MLTYNHIVYFIPYILRASKNNDTQINIGMRRISILKLYVKFNFATTQSNSAKEHIYTKTNP